MRESLNGEGSPRESIERREEECSVAHTPHTLHNNKEQRHPINIRIRRSIHNIFMEYCGTDMTAGQFYEEAGILFMDLNPKDRSIFIVEKPQRNNLSVKGRMLTMICTQELEDVIPVLKRLTDNGRKIHKNLLERLSKTFDKCYKINTPNAELKVLIEEALKYVE